MAAQMQQLLMPSQGEYVNIFQLSRHPGRYENNHMFPWNLRFRTPRSAISNSEHWEQKQLVLVVKNKLNLLSTLMWLQFYPSSPDFSCEHANHLFICPQCQSAKCASHLTFKGSTLWWHEQKWNCEGQKLKERCRITQLQTRNDSHHATLAGGALVTEEVHSRGRCCRPE